MIFCLPEPVKENPYLEEYYKDPHSTAFKMQVFLLNARYKAFQKAQWESLSNPSIKIVADRSFYDDLAFARVQRKEGYMSDLDFRTYQDLHLTYQMSLLFPELIIYFRLTPEQALERINQRGRECENSISLSYLKDLYDAYEDMMDELSLKTNVVYINAYQSRSSVLNECIDAVNVKYDQMMKDRSKGRFAGYMGSFIV